METGVTTEEHPAAFETVTPYEPVVVIEMLDVVSLFDHVKPVPPFAVNTTGVP